VSDWLSQLKAGDEVVVSGGFRRRLEKIARVTETQIVICEGTVATRYNRKNGYRVGERGYDTPRLSEPTAVVRDEIVRASLVHHITRANFDSVSTQALRRAYELLCKGATP
jgi:hypothetical protein